MARKCESKNPRKSGDRCGGQKIKPEYSRNSTIFLPEIWQYALEDEVLYDYEHKVGTYDRNHKANIALNAKPSFPKT